MNDKKLKYSELKDYRDIALYVQNNTCPLCLDEIRVHDANLDHCHSSGRVRAVLHPACNILLGKIENFIKRYPRGLKDDTKLANFLNNAYSYMVASYNSNAFHPKHLTPDDKLRRKYKRLLKRSKRPETKQKYSTLLEKLK